MVCEFGGFQNVLRDACVRAIPTSRVYRLSDYYSHDKSIYTTTAKLGVTIGKCVHNTLKVKLHCKYNKYKNHFMK